MTWDEVAALRQLTAAELWVNTGARKPYRDFLRDLEKHGRRLYRVVGEEAIFVGLSPQRTTIEASPRYDSPKVGIRRIPIQNLAEAPPEAVETALRIARARVATAASRAASPGPGRPPLPTPRKESPMPEPLETADRYDCYPSDLLLGRRATLRGELVVIFDAMDHGDTGRSYRVRFLGLGRDEFAWCGSEDLTLVDEPSTPSHACREAEEGAPPTTMRADRAYAEALRHHAIGETEPDDEMLLGCDAVFRREHVRIVATRRDEATGRREVRVEFVERTAPTAAWVPASDVILVTKPAAPLTFARLREANLRERLRAHFHPLEEWNAAEWACAVGGEAGELLNKIKKLRRRGPGATPTPEEAEGIAKEIGDTIIYLDLLAARLGMDLGECVRFAFDETSARIGCGVTL